MSQFSNLEQAERWVTRLEGLAVETDDIEERYNYDEAARELKRAISKVQYGCADKDDLRIYYAAISARTARDAELEIRRALV